MSDVTSDDARKPRPPKMEIFRGDQGVPLTEEQMPSEGLDESVLAGFAKLRDAFANVPEGTDVQVEKIRCLYRSPDPKGLSLVYAWFKSGFLLPRHSHDADCLYYVIGGELKMGATVLRKGDGVLVPAGHGYTYEAGPNGVEVLEFRNASTFNILYKEDDASHWDRMAATFRAGLPRWVDETLPPSAQ